MSDVWCGAEQVTPGDLCRQPCIIIIIIIIIITLQVIQQNIPCNAELIL
jgi:hypothetical protein